MGIIKELTMCIWEFYKPTFSSVTKFIWKISNCNIAFDWSYGFNNYYKIKLFNQYLIFHLNKNNIKTNLLLFILKN